jgi:hypothetical protein
LPLIISLTHLPHLLLLLPLFFLSHDEEKVSKI